MAKYLGQILDIIVKYMVIMWYHLIKLLFCDQLHLPVTMVFPITSTSFLSCVFLMGPYRSDLGMNSKINPYKVNVQISSPLTCHLLYLPRSPVILWNSVKALIDFTGLWFVLILSGIQKNEGVWLLMDLKGAIRSGGEYLLPLAWWLGHQMLVHLEDRPIYHFLNCLVSFQI